MSLLLAMLLYSIPASSSSVRTNESLSVLHYSNLLTIAPLDQETTSGASPTGQELETSSLQRRLERQNQLFKEQAASDATPTSGDKKSLLDDFSLAASVRQDAIDREFRTELAAISPDGFPEQDRISHELMLRELDQRMTDYSLKIYEMPLTQFRGIHTDLADVPRSLSFHSVKDYEDYITRLHEMPLAFEQTVEVLKQGEKDRLMPVRLLLEQVPAQCQGIIAEDPFLLPTTKFPASIPAADQKRLTDEIVNAANNEVLPAYKRFAAFVANDYALHGRTAIGLSSLPDGVQRYQNAIHEQTTTNMTPAEIHALGLREIARINGLLTDLAHKAGYPDLKSFRAALNSDPRYIPTSADQIVEDYRHYVNQMEPRLPELFLNYPKTKLVVEAIPASQPQMGTHHVDGSADGSTPGRVVVATSNYAHRRLISDETQAYHEGIPGHELQVTIEQHLKDLPAFRSQIRNNAYIEGWAVYAEALGKEIGFFQDPASDYGRLNLELMRAVRFVVDTGIHADGWTRDQAVTYFRESGAADEPTIQSEIDRYIALPAQSLSYKIGQLKIRELRARAQQQLGPRFDIRKFHDQILSAGSLPMDMLDARINGWIKSEQVTGEKSVQPQTGS
ncbi:DUF885 domain-containing protein [Terriglobus saanensis]|uniref:DUF885 domain-containing protein n=1 Tax=Terriglobus saanensis (strain ATCC BAA-1853 / DSM 23119 / SP1PR4) TaxID=401053 RepID=E8V0K3_TERSS|nr:DUF885 domain-containing protein [Terriglobus saanensis]ADV84486.1 protein of unknown function DUF885 [Terriglobus saanensis SP1PR4]